MYLQDITKFSLLHSVNALYIVLICTARMYSAVYTMHLIKYLYFKTIMHESVYYVVMVTMYTLYNVHYTCTQSHTICTISSTGTS